MAKNIVVILPALDKSATSLSGMTFRLLLVEEGPDPRSETPPPGLMDGGVAACKPDKYSVIKTLVNSNNLQSSAACLPALARGEWSMTTFDAETQRFFAIIGCLFLIIGAKMVRIISTKNTHKVEQSYQNEELTLDICDSSVYL